MIEMTVSEFLATNAVRLIGEVQIYRNRGRAILKEAKRCRTELRAARREIEILKSSGETANTAKEVTIEITSFEKGVFVIDEDLEELFTGGDQ